MKKIMFTVLICALVLPSVVFAQRGAGTSTPTFRLTVTANVNHADVEIIGGAISGSILGKTPFSVDLAKEVYRITVSAPGYNSRTRTITLGSDQTVNFNLAPANYSLNITSNIPGARVRVQGQGKQINGTSNMSVELPPGTYQIAVVAPGYQVQTQQIVLNGNQTVSFVLQPVTARVAIILGPAILNPRLGNPAAQVKVFDNGRPLKDMVTDLNPGQHTIRVESGGVVFETTLVLEPGKEYRIEPYGGFIVNGEKM